MMLSACDVMLLTVTVKYDANDGVQVCAGFCKFVQHFAGYCNIFSYFIVVFILFYFKLADGFIKQFFSYRTIAFIHSFIHFFSVIASCQTQLQEENYVVLYQAAKKGSIFRKTPTGGITRRIWYRNVRENVYFSDLSLYFENFLFNMVN